MIAFLDACVVIYRFEGSDRLRDQVREVLASLEREGPDLEVAVSRLSRVECLAKPLRQKDREALARYDEFFGNTDLRIVELTGEVIESALRVRVETGLKTPDAIQAACAMTLSGSVVFVTGDRGFCRVSGLRVVMIGPF